VFHDAVAVRRMPRRASSSLVSRDPGGAFWGLWLRVSVPRLDRALHARNVTQVTQRHDSRQCLRQRKEPTATDGAQVAACDIPSRVA
jgi:hypothetical protein